MDLLPRRPSGSGAVGLFPNGGLKTKINGEERRIIDQTGIHLHPSDFNGLDLPCLPLVDELGELHYLSVTSQGELNLDGKTIGKVTEEPENETPTD